MSEPTTKMSEHEQALRETLKYSGMNSGDFDSDLKQAMDGIMAFSGQDQVDYNPHLHRASILKGVEQYQVDKLRGNMIKDYVENDGYPNIGNMDISTKGYTTKMSIESMLPKGTKPQEYLNTVKAGYKFANNAEAILNHYESYQNERAQAAALAAQANVVPQTSSSASAEELRSGAEVVPPTSGEPSVAPKVEPPPVSAFAEPTAEQIAERDKKLEAQAAYDAQYDATMSKMTIGLKILENFMPNLRPLLAGMMQKFMGMMGDNMGQLSGLFGDSPAMKAVQDSLVKYAFTDTPAAEAGHEHTEAAPDVDAVSTEPTVKGDSLSGNFAETASVSLVGVGSVQLNASAVKLKEEASTDLAELKEDPAHKLDHVAPAQTLAV